MQDIKTLKELQQITKAFDTFSTIEECDIPEYYKAIFPKRCSCGAEMIMTKTARTQLQCCNPCCWVKMAHRLNYFISYHGFKDFGEQTCLSLFAACKDELEYTSFLSVFMLTDTQLSRALGDSKLSIFHGIKEDLATNTFMFGDAIASLGIPNVGSRSVIFDYVKSPITFLDYMLKGKVEDLCDMVGIQALSTRFHLSCFDIDTLLLMTDVMPNIVATPKGEMFIAITGKVSVDGVSYTRSEFIDLCERIHDANGSQLYKICETKAQDKLQYVIADGPSTSSKYELGQKLNILITAEEFYKALLETANTGEKGDTKPCQETSC